VENHFRLAHSLLLARLVLEFDGLLQGDLTIYSVEHIHPEILQCISQPKVPLLQPCYIHYHTHSFDPTNTSMTNFTMATIMASQLIPTQIPSDFRMVSMLDAAYFEDLPPYTPVRSRDTDTISIHSAAPSYRSEPPEYNDVEPLSREFYYQETSFFDDSQDDIIMTEVAVEEQAQDQVQEDQDEPLTPTQSRMDAVSQQQSSMLFPDELQPLTPTVSRRAVPPSPPMQPSSLLNVEQQPETDDLEFQAFLEELTQGEPQQDFEPRGLPRMSWAPGFRPLDAFSAANYSFINVSTPQRNPSRNHYDNVARRRVREREEAIANNLLTLTSPSIEQVLHTLSEEVPELTADNGSPGSSRETTPTPASPITPTAATSLILAAQSPPSSPTTPTRTILRPQEDPELVGHAAADRARQQREYREMLTKDQNRALQLESAGWDFMLAQSRDWEERQSSWASFRQSRMRKAERRAAQGRSSGIQGFQGFGGGLLRIMSRG
jgi:hypothetical protein